MQYWMLTFVAMIALQENAKGQSDPVEDRMQTLVEALRENKHKFGTKECDSVVSSISSDVKFMSERLDHCKITQDPEVKEACDQMSSNLPKVLDFYLDIVTNSCKTD
uniref:Uncharacterized protein n=1 Tax=Homalodisca liturata TaxID=320908 RepID=A0A1B6J224_9HEMI